MNAATQKPANAAKLTTPTDRSIHIERVFNAAKDRVWRAITEPDLLVQWWGRGNKLVIETLDFRKGGHWRFVEHVDGVAHGFEGRYREIVPGESVSLTFEWDGLPGHTIINDMRLEDLGDGRTRLVSEMSFFNTDERDGMMQAGMEGGMNESYAALDRLLATM